MRDNSSPLVSVVTPTYNRANTLPRLWQSLRAQRLARFEWLVVDDGSTDNTQAVVAKWMAEDSRIRYIRHDTNQGVNKSRQTGSECAAAPYIVFIDSDDALFDEETLGLMYSEIVAAPAKVGAVCFAAVYDDGRPACYIAHHKLTLHYEDVICDNLARGEFLFICRREYLESSPWSPYRVLEQWHHYARARHYDVMFVRRPARIVYSDGGCRLSDPDSVFRYSDVYHGLLEMIDQHGDTWLKHCPQRYHYYQFMVALYAVLAGNVRLARSYALNALRGGYPIWKVGAVIFCSFIPASWRKALFRLWATKLRARLTHTEPAR